MFIKVLSLFPEIVKIDSRVASMLLLIAQHGARVEVRAKDVETMMALPYTTTLWLLNVCAIAGIADKKNRVFVFNMRRIAGKGNEQPVYLARLHRAVAIYPKRFNAIGDAKEEIDRRFPLLARKAPAYTGTRQRNA